MQKNAYGELMVKYVGNRWVYIGGSEATEVSLPGNAGSDPTGDADSHAGEQPDKLSRKVMGR